MNPQSAFRFLALFCATALTVACGGSGSGSGQIAGIDRTGTPSFALAFGTVTGFGSIIVNGVHYDTTSASFTIDDSPGGQDDLAVGDIVLVRGSLSSDRTSGTATSVTFDDNVEGPIASFGADRSTFIVLGQTVVVNADTSFDDSISPPSLAGLSLGDVVEVSGFVDANGAVLATRIEPKAPGGELEVTGLVSSHDAGAMTFMINGLVVDYSAAMLQDFPGGTVADGDLVEAKGTTIGAGGELVATSVELEDGRVSGDDEDHVEIEGLVTHFVSAMDFDVSGLPVSTDGQTIFEGGVATDLGLNVKVEVEGELDPAGVLVADKVDIRRSSDVRIDALVDSVDPAGGSLVVLGIAVSVGTLTRMEDKLNDVEPFGLGDLAAGEFVSIRGSVDPSVPGAIVASLLERDDPDDTSLRGFVESFTEPALQILGVAIDTTGAQFRDTDDSPLTSLEFFAKLDVGDLVDAKGTEVAATAIDASEVELE